MGKSILELSCLLGIKCEIVRRRFLGESFGWRKTGIFKEPRILFGRSDSH